MAAAPETLSVPTPRSPTMMPLLVPNDDVKVPPLMFATPIEPMPPAAMVIRLLLMVVVPAL